MSLIYDNLSLPVFVTLTFIIPIFILRYFRSKRSENPTAFFVGIVFLCLAANSAGVVRLLREFNLFEEYSNMFGAIPIPFVLLSIIMIFTGAYQKVKHDTIKRNRVILISVMQVLIVMFILFLGIFKPWE